MKGLTLKIEELEERIAPQADGGAVAAFITGFPANDSGSPGASVPGASGTLGLDVCQDLGQAQLEDDAVRAVLGV